MSQEQPTLADQIKALRAQSLNQYVATMQVLDLVEQQAKEIERLKAIDQEKTA